MRVIDFFDRGVNLYPNNLAFVEPGSEISYAQAGIETHYIASAIRGRGYQKGAKLGILAPNCNVAFIALMGLMRSEAIWLPINPRNSVEANVDLLTRFDGELLFYHSDYELEALAVKAQVSSIKEIVCIDGGSSTVTSLADWSRDFQCNFLMGDEDPEDLFAIFPTGGTTGKSKGVMIQHRALEAFYRNYYEAFRYDDNSRHLVVAPMTHSAGIMGFAHFARGGTNFMMKKADPEEIMKAVEIYKITHFFVPPTVLYMILALPHVERYDTRSLQHLLIGAAPTSLEKLKQAIKVFGPVLTEAFGQTEAPGAITVKAPKDYLDENGAIIESRLASIGRPGVFNLVAILDDEGNEVARGERGEICIKGDLVTVGYYKNTQATAEVREFGWHHTGDIATQDEDGFIKIVDRKKDMIITGGFNVFPNEIEQALMTYPAIQDCAVIGVPDDKWGEAVKAVVQLKPGGSATESEIIAHARSLLDGVKTPKSVELWNDLPRSPAGKVLKTEIRKPFWEGCERGVN